MTPDSYAFTCIGGREENQDAHGIRQEGDALIAVVADGLGGHSDGALASARAVERLLGQWQPETAWDQEKLTELVQTAHQAILNLQRERNSSAKSTAVLLILEGERAFWAHTGDSRLYRLRDGEIASVTEDHSVAYMKYRAGEITRAQIASDEDQSSLLRALGSSLRWKPQTAESGLLPGDAFLLCTDGLWEYVTDEEILIDRLKAENARDWAERMLLRAAERIPDNNDNMTLMTLITE